MYSKPYGLIRVPDLDKTFFKNFVYPTQTHRLSNKLRAEIIDEY